MPAAAKEAARPSHDGMAAEPAAVPAVPLTPQQQGLWFVHQVVPACGAYHLLFSLAVEGPALRWGDGRWLETLLAGLMDEHPVLRVRMRAHGDQPVQEADADARPALRWLDMRGMGDDAVRGQARQDARQPIDPAQAPMWRVHLYRTHDQRWVAMAVVHHMLLDFWSLGLLLSQVAGRLGLCAAGPVPDGRGFLLERQAPAAVQQAEPAWWPYWKKALSGAPLLHGLPTDRPRPASLSHEGASLPFALGCEASDGVRQVAQSRQATPFMVLLAAYAVWIHRLSGDTDIVLASPTAGRLRRAQRHMLGHFVNTLPLRVTVRSEHSFADVLARVSGTVVEALRHQEAPFSSLVERLSPRRDPGIDPLAQLGFSWERVPLMEDFANFFLPEAPTRDEGHRLGELRLAPFPVPQQEGQLDLLMEMGGERDGALVGILKYRTALFDEATVSHWLRAWTVLVGRLVSAPEQPVGRVAMVAGEPPRALCGDGTWRELHGASALDLIRQTAQRAPDAPAVQDGGAGWTHAQLQSRAWAIAVALRSLGVAPGAHVGLMLDRCADLPAAILGIWWAGAAYVPMDPRYPRQRLHDIAEDAGLAALVSQQAHRALWPEGVAALPLDAPWPTDAAASDLPGANPAGVAYLIYTSGSTGKPKGVRIGHRSVLNFLQSMQARLSPGPKTRLMAVTTPAFDISVLELLLPLLAGGCVVVADTALLGDGVALGQALDAQRVSLMQATPATWKLLLDAGWVGRPAMVALCGGEALPQWLADALQPRCAALWNVYGPTETTVWSTAARLGPGEPVHLGDALDNTSLFVLDERRQPVPRGVFGELWIGGDGLAVDYWQRPELTADRFTAVPALSGAGRLYRTGDRVRFNGQGRLEHHGRLDFQVKLRGFRIELGEIEALLKQHPAVRDCVAALQGGEAPPGPQLAAYVVVGQAGDAPPSPAELRHFLAERLPSHMLPSAFVFLEALPQTPNGKVDRKALAPPALADRVVVSSERVAPRDALEIQLAGIFERLLGLPDIGIHDDFFELGGHSLLAVRVVADIRQSLAVDLPVAELMRHGSVAALAERLRGQADAAPASLLVPLVQPPRDGAGAPQPLWLFHPIGGTVFCYLALSRRLAPGRPVWAVQSPGLSQEGEAEVTVEAMASRYLAEVKAVQPQGPYLLGGWCFGGVIAFEAARQLRQGGQEVDQVVLIDTRAPVAANMPSDGDDATLMSWFARDLAVPYGKKLDIPAPSLRGLPAERMFEHVLGAARAIDVLPADANEAQLARYFEAYLANGIALQTHLPSQQEVPVLLVRAKDEPADYGPLLGWDTLAHGPFLVLDAPGDHNTVVHPPQAADVAAMIDRHAPCVRLPQR